MTEKETVSKLKGQVQALLTKVEQAGKRNRPVELWENSQVVNDLKHLLFLLRVPQEAQDAMAEAEALDYSKSRPNRFASHKPFEYPKGTCQGCGREDVSVLDGFCGDCHKNQAMSL